MMMQPAKGKLVESITKLLMASGDVSGFPMIAKAFEDMPPNQAKFNMIAPFSEMIGKVESTEQVKRGVNEIVKFRNAIPEQYGLTPVMNNFLNQIIEAKEKQSETSSNKSALTEQIDYIKSVIIDSKKGF